MLAIQAETLLVHELVLHTGSPLHDMLNIAATASYAQSMQLSDVSLVLVHIPALWQAVMPQPNAPLSRLIACALACWSHDAEHWSYVDAGALLHEAMQVA